VKIKLDENLPDGLVAVLTELGHDVDTVHAEQLTGCTDPDVWSAAQAAQRFLITQDLDFSDMRRYLPGTHAVCFSCVSRVRGATPCTSGCQMCSTPRTSKTGRDVSWSRPNKKSV